MSEVDLCKQNAALKTCEILREMKNTRIVGLGTGSTIKVFIDICIDKLREFAVVVSSIDTLIYTRKYGIRAIDLLEVDDIDVSIDGADEVSSRLDIVKGRGGALLREKTIALLSNTRIYVVDYTKYTGYEYLFAKPIPIEIIPVTFNYVMREINRIGLFETSLRMSRDRDGPVLTDNGNFIIDLKPRKPIYDPGKIHHELKLIHGVVETGIFPSTELVDFVVIGYRDRVDVLKSTRSPYIGD